PEPDNRTWFVRVSAMIFRSLPERSCLSWSAVVLASARLRLRIVTLPSAAAGCGGMPPGGTFWPSNGATTQIAAAVATATRTVILDFIGLAPDLSVQNPCRGAAA